MGLKGYRLWVMGQMNSTLHMEENGWPVNKTRTAGRCKLNAVDP
jgi:hypothetical protein